MPICLFRLIASLAFATLTAACAGSPPTFAPPPRISLPAAVTMPCRLPVLPDLATEADLERVYMERGAALIACDGARRLAVEALAAERSLSGP
jgi:hypothetical protein